MKGSEALIPNVKVFSNGLSRERCWSLQGDLTSMEERERERETERETETETESKLNEHYYSQ